MKELKEEKNNFDEEIRKKDKIIEDLKNEKSHFKMKQSNEDDQKFVVLKNQFINLEEDYKVLVEENKLLLEKNEEQSKIIDILKKKQVFIKIYISFVN